MTRLWLISTFASVLLVSGCGDNGSGTGQTGGQSSSIGVAITPASVTLYEAQTVQFKAKVTGTDNPAVSWSVEDHFGTIDNTGLYTAPHDGTGGPFHVIATSKADASVQAKATFTVLPVEVMISPGTPTLHPGGTQTFIASIKGLPDNSVTWSITEASGGSITSSGSYTAPAQTGFYHVNATSLADPSRTGAVVLTVTTSSASFTPTPNMNAVRNSATATLLPDGRVLLAGGTIKRSGLCPDGRQSTEIYNPVVNSYMSAGGMNSARYGHSATLLPSGEVLLAGGYSSGHDCEDIGSKPATAAELFNPAAGTFRVAAALIQDRAFHTGTLLSDGRVLLAGGSNGSGASLDTAEIYEPRTAVFSPTGNMNAPRSGHTATLLGDGKVLIVGGRGTDIASSSAEIYDPATGSFTPTGSMAVGRTNHTATLLSSGDVLIAGGATNSNGTSAPVASAEIYNVAAGTFSSTRSMGLARTLHTATLLVDGSVLIAGGGSSTAEIFRAGSFSPVPEMSTEREEHTATLLKTGAVLVAGGSSTASADLFQP